MLSADAYQKWTDNGQIMIASLTARKQSDVERMWVYNVNNRGWRTAAQAFQRFKREVRTWLKTDDARTTSFWLTVGSVAAPLGGAALGGAPGATVGFWVGFALGGIATGIDCARGDGFGCGLGAIGLVLGPIGKFASGISAVVAKIWDGHAAGLGIGVSGLQIVTN